MLRKVKYGKTAAVVCLTALVWVWADLAMDVELPVHNATIGVVKSNPKIWANLDRDSFEMVLKGPAAKIAEVKKKLKEGPGLEFYLDVAQEKMDDPGSYSVNLLAFLQRDREIKRLGLKVESCKPDRLFVTVVGLEERELEVKCVDEAGNLVTAAVDPTHVSMYVSEDWQGTAEVQLSYKEIDQARISAIEKTPYIELASGQKRSVGTTIRIKVPPEEDPRGEYRVRATLAIALSPVLQGKYEVVVTNLDEVMGAIMIRATPDAKRAYEAQEHAPMTLYIFDDDAKKGTAEQRREVVYNFPPDSFQRGEIELNQQPVKAQFKLVELSTASSAETTSGGAE